MKKFMLLSLALFTMFSAGCGSSGSDNPAAPSNQINTGSVRTSLTLAVPAADVNPSLRAAYWKDFVLQINGVLYQPTSSSTVGLNVNLTYNLTIASSTLGTSWSATSQSISNVSLIQAGQVLATFTLPASDLSTSMSVPPSPAVVTVTVTKDSNGTITITGSNGTVISQKVTNIAQTLTVEKIEYYVGTTSYTLTETSTNVPVTPAFIITFNASVSGAISSDGATPSWNIVVSKLDANNAVLSSFTLDSTTDSSLFLVNYTNAPDRKALTVTLTANSDTKKLTAGYKYSVTLNSSSLFRYDVPVGSTAVRLSPITRTFTTAQ
ncbi:MAG: hypothetical protein HQM09_19830 [Candidatus Riflebacteria bacterium]|nr:hypothetical protein [Candidatus Riflebacteria bacterium]